MTIQFACANGSCQKMLKVRDELAGKRIRCPACDVPQEVPEVPEVEEVLEVVAADEGEEDNLALRFFGEDVDPALRRTQLVANPALENPLSLQLLFDHKRPLHAAGLTRTLRGYHPRMTQGLVELDPAAVAKGTPFGLAGWGKHVIKIVGFNIPMPGEVVERCVQPAHYGQELKQKARAHKAHALLYYAGYVDSALEQYVALAAVAGVLASQGAILVLNESGHCSFPAGALAKDAESGDMLELLRALPLLHLYCGFVKYDVEGVKGVWMRSHGAHFFGLPDFAYRAAGHNQGQEIFDVFSNTLTYLLDSGATLDVGHTMQVGADFFIRLRAPKKKEYFLESEGELFVMERIDESEVN